MIKQFALCNVIGRQRRQARSREVSLKDLCARMKTDYQFNPTKRLALFGDILKSYHASKPTVRNLNKFFKHYQQRHQVHRKGYRHYSVRYFPGDKRVEFAVADTGIGIAPEETQHIFERFHQVDSSQTAPSRRRARTVYVKEFSALLGGKIAVESEPEKGSTFTVAIQPKCQHSWERSKYGRPAARL